eukprot:6040662-Amphidinium_carterae.1
MPPSNCPSDLATQRNYKHLSCLLDVNVQPPGPNGSDVMSMTIAHAQPQALADHTWRHSLMLVEEASACNFAPAIRCAQS